MWWLSHVGPDITSSSQADEGSFPSDANNRTASAAEDTEELAKVPKQQQQHRRRLGRRGIIYFRPIKTEDRNVIQTLHEQWFPVDYKSDFFDGLCNDRIMPGTNQVLYSCVACFKELDDLEFEEMYEKRERESCSMPSFWSKGKHSLTSKYYCNETNDECILWDGELVDDKDSVLSETTQHTNHISKVTQTKSNDNNSNQANDERERMKRFYSNGFQYDKYNQQNDFYANECGELIVGCVVGTFLPSSMHNAKTGRRDDTAELLIPDPDEYPEMFYIMTLGTTRDFRRVGLGSILVNRVVDMIRSKQECGALYLHVIIYNEGAIKLYERLGFSRVKRITGEREALNLESKMYSYLRSNTSIICLHF
jgi:ribosomal protein S18 acetylase RimI-like enzyme